MFNIHPSKKIIGEKSKLLFGKRVALALCSSSAIFKSPELARELMRFGAEVYTLMTPNATKLINPKLMKWATGNDVIIDVTGDVEGFVNGSFSNYGWVIKCVDCSAVVKNFASREYSDASKRPKLVVEYVEPNTVTTTVTQTITETQTVTETTTVANTTITETQTETITTTQTINNTVYSTVTTTVANTTYYTTIYETISPAYGNETANYYTDLANQLVPLVMVIGVICSLLGLLLSATGGRR